jgi:hypothetical protein
MFELEQAITQRWKPGVGAQTDTKQLSLKSEN